MEPLDVVNRWNEAWNTGRFRTRGAWQWSLEQPRRTHRRSDVIDQVWLRLSGT